MAFQQKFEANAMGALMNSQARNQGNNGAGAVGQRHCAAMEEIWRTHARQLLRLTLRITRNREDAEDALQDSFLRAHVHLDGFDGRSSITTWLTRIAINSALMIVRKRAKARQVSIDDPAAGADLPSLAASELSPNPEQRYGQLEQETRASQALGRLRPPLRQALELRTTEERSIKEIAERMGLSISATKSRIFHAKAALRKSLEPNLSRRSARTKSLELSPA
jgi:RNA polymerase sigma factor (sigma-70 family)